MADISEKAITQFRIDNNTYQKVKYIADMELRSANSQLEYFVLQGVREYEAANGEIIIRKTLT